MAHSLSSKKRNRQNVKRRAVNRARRSTLKTKQRKCADLITHGNAAEGETQCRDLFKTLDREANRRTLHRNAAARRKSRLARKLNTLKQKAPA